MYNPVVRLHTNVCKVCMRIFKNEKALKDHLFNRRVNDKKHLQFKEEIRSMRFQGAKVTCPVCSRKIFRAIGNHFNHAKDHKHKVFLIKQKKFILDKYFSGKSCIDISKILHTFTTSFSPKYILRTIVNSIGKQEFYEISDAIFSQKRKCYWAAMPPEKKKEIMKKVREAEWAGLTSEERRNHPWVVAGRNASLRSAKRGSKNQQHAFALLKQKLPSFNWEYNYMLDDGWHIDIAAPEQSLFIEWDGRHHFVPIHGQSYLNNRINRDKKKDQIITQHIKGSLIRVRDEGKADPCFVEKKVCQILELLDKGITKGELIHL